jgi:cytochrome P450
MNEVGLEDRVSRLLAGDPEALAEPFSTWNELRELHPVWRYEGSIVLSSHAGVRELLGDNNNLYSRAEARDSARYRQARNRFSPQGRKAFDTVLDEEFNQLVRMDPPDHPRVRKVVTPPFTARNLAREMEDAVNLRVTEMLDELAAGDGVTDFKRFAYTLPLKVLGDLLGIPLDDLDLVHLWAHKIAENKFNADSENAAIEAEDAYRGLLNYIEDLVLRQRRSGNTTGLVAALIAAEAAGTIRHDELVSMLALMIFAGHETTSNLLSIGMLELLKHREQWDLLCSDPALTEPAVEELLRFVSPAHFLQYVAIKPRDLAGVSINAGDTVIGVLAAANRDPDVFDRPNSLDITRTDSRQHVSLGLGPHFCLGAGLARMEATMLFRGMATRFQSVRLTDDAIEWGGRSLRTPLTMPIKVNG